MVMVWCVKLGKFFNFYMFCNIYDGYFDIVFGNVRIYVLMEYEFGIFGICWWREIESILKELVCCYFVDCYRLFNGGVVF